MNKKRGGGFNTDPDSVEVDIEIVMAEQEETQPRLECVDRNDEEDPDDPALFCRVGVVSEVLVDLLASQQNGSPGASSSQTLP